MRESSPRRETLVDFFNDFTDLSVPFLVHDDGYRSHTWTYEEVGRRSKAFAAFLNEIGIHKGQRILIWSENRPEWLIALWGAILAGVVVVPIDYRASTDLVKRIAGIVEAKALLTGQDVDPGDASNMLKVLTLEDVTTVRASAFSPPPAARDDVVEIIFTSGATAEPKGVVITHRNILANIVPIEREVLKYRRYGRVVFPIRFLNLLPLSHMFGQAMATFIPPMLPGMTVFMRGYNPGEIVRQVRTRRVSVVVCVPKILDVLRDFVCQQVPGAAEPAAGGHVLRRWWRHRRVHELFGWKFWAFVVGAAPLDPALEEHWSRLGCLVIQGYGLTETAPIVTLNHPFHIRRGTVGKPIAGVDVRIAPDGEVLVRGENVTTGYFGRPADTDEAFEGGWLHTGDIGELDDSGRLFIRGRKKEIIVTPEGLNVFPEDVERVLKTFEGVRDAAVVGHGQDGEERVHAVLLLAPGVEPDAVIRHANAQLEEYQRVRGYSRWPGPDLPRTEGTRKLKRRALREWVETGAAVGHAGAGDADTVEAVVGRLARGRAVSQDTTLEELGLSSLERMELLMALERQFGVSLDEFAFVGARTVGDMAALVRASAGGGATDPGPEGVVAPETVAAAAVAPETIHFPTWNRTRVARVARRVSLATWIGPLTRVFAWLKVDGREHLAGITSPIVFAANHQSHMDTPIVLAALPASWRYRTATAMAKEFFRAHFFPEQHTTREWLTNSVNYYLAALFFNAFPLPQREAGTRQTLRYIGRLIDEGESVLIYPEGRRTMEGTVDSFLPGIGLIGARLGVPVIPVRVHGAHNVLHQTWKMARPGVVRVAFGAPLRLEGDDYPALARQVEDAVRAL